jgi:protein-tyrosine kinase
MKIKKALDKAKQAKETKKTEPDYPEFKESIITKKANSLFPIYSESRNINLNPLKIRKNRCVGMFPDSPEINYYKILREQIYLLTREQGWNTVMVTSVQPGEGKTLTAINLSLTFAKEYNQTVLLVDCDFQKQKIHKYLGIASDKGLIDYLINDSPLNDLILWPGIEKMSLISGGKTVKESTELLSSPKMKSLVHEMKNRYDDRYVIFDVPPILGGADTIAFAPLVDSIIMVVESGLTTNRDVKKALELIPKEKFLGFVMNKQKPTKDPYYLYY